MRLSSWLACLFLLSRLGSAEQPWEQTVPVPPGVRYHQAKREANAPTVERVRTIFGPDYAGTEKLSDVMLICGPFLWRRLKILPALSGDKGIPANFKVGNLNLVGRGFHKDPQLVAAVVDAVRAELKEDGGFQVRKLNLQELGLLWAIYPSDLEDPLLLLESPHHLFVLIFVHDELFQIDDFYQASLNKAEAPKATKATPGAAHPFVKETARQFWSKPHERTNAGQLISGEGIQLLSDDEVIHRSLTTDQFIAYVKLLTATRQRVMAGAGKTPRNLSLQVELCPDGDFFTVVCQPALPVKIEQQLIEELRSIPHPPIRSVVATQLFARVWGGVR